MICRFEKDKIIDILLNQISNLYFKTDTDLELLHKYFPAIIKRVEENFVRQHNKYYSRCAVPEDETTRDAYFDPLHTCQWLIFLYYTANTIYKADKSTAARELCDKIYGLSKMISGADLYYEIDLPAFFPANIPRAP